MRSAGAADAPEAMAADCNQVILIQTSTLCWHHDFVRQAKHPERNGTNLYRMLLRDDARPEVGLFSSGQQSHE